ncbi:MULTISPECIES: hypothetical protein [Streptomyces]|uniref:hypothetical protein n=1 Tax=Streptomyces TaxID=1883 RepID=UPI0014896325|nr:MULTISPECIES: hypothetical protein [Streptomyces]
MTTAPARLNPEQLAERLDALGDTAGAVFVRALAREAEVLRGERDALATFARTIAALSGNGRTANTDLSGQAHEALDTLRVTGRCPVSESRRHSAKRSGSSGLTRCGHCHARLRRS